MSKYTTVKTWVSGEILYAAELNNEFSTIKAAVNAIALEQMSADSVGTTQLVASSVTTAKLADDAVTTDKLADNSVTLADSGGDEDTTTETPIIAHGAPVTVQEKEVEITVASTPVLIMGYVRAEGDPTDRALKVYLEVDRNDGAGYVELMAFGGILSTDGMLGNSDGSGGWPVPIMKLDAATVVGTQAYRIRIRNNNAGSSISYYNYDLIVIALKR